MYNNQTTWDDNFEGCRDFPQALYILDTYWNPLYSAIQLYICFITLCFFCDIIMLYSYTLYIIEYKYSISLMMIDSITSEPPELSLAKLSERNGPPGAAR